MQPLPGQRAPLHAGQAVKGPTAGSWGHSVSGELHMRCRGHSDMLPAGRREGRVLTAACVSGGRGQCSAEKTEGGLAAALRLARSHSRDQCALESSQARTRERGSSAQCLGVK